MTDSPPPTLSSGRRALLFIIVGGLAAAALVSAGFVVFGDQSAIVARALWTVLILMAFALIVLAETRARHAESWVLPLRVAGWVISAFVAMFNTWDYRTGLEDTLYLFPLTLISIVVIQLAVLFIWLSGRAYWKDPSPVVSFPAFVATGVTAIVAFLIVLPLTVRPDDLFGDTYWRIVAALAIIAGVAAIISPLVRAITRPREERPAAPLAPPAVPQAPVGGVALAQPNWAPPAAPVAWPTYYGTNVPLPVMPDGQPDMMAYQTGQPSPGSRPYGT